MMDRQLKLFESPSDHPKSVRVVVVGSRDFNDFIMLEAKLNELRKSCDIEYIVSGGARGADNLAEKYRSTNGCKVGFHF